MKQRTQYILAVSIILLGLVSGLLLQSEMKDPEEKIRIPENTTSESIEKPLNFQGKMNNIKTTNGGIALDTRTKTVEETITSGKALAGSTEKAVYIQRSSGTYRYANGETVKAGFDSAYGSVTSDFDYPGFNIIYANKNREVYLRNLDTGNEKKIFENALEVVKVDKNQNGVPESAEIRLSNGSTITFEPQSSKSSRKDWDNDGLNERIYIKNSHLYMYDSKHGQEKLAPATDFLQKQHSIYTAYNGQVNRLSFEQITYQTGVYTSNPVEFNKTRELVMLIVDAELNKGSIEAVVNTTEEIKEIQIKDGLNDYWINLEGKQAMVKFMFRKGEGESPEILDYKLVHRGK